MQEKWYGDWCRWKMIWRNYKNTSVVTRELLQWVTGGKTGSTPEQVRGLLRHLEKVRGTPEAVDTLRTIRAVTKGKLNIHQTDISQGRQDHAWRTVAALLSSRPMILPALKYDALPRDHRDHFRMPYAFTHPNLSYREPTKWDRLHPAVICAQCKGSIYYGAGQNDLFDNCRHCTPVQREFDALAPQLTPDDWLFWANKLNDMRYEFEQVGILADWLEDRGVVLEVARLRALEPGEVLGQ
jgi:hypothetical protein